MKLNEWLFKNKISKKDFADSIGYSRAYLHHVMAGMTTLSDKFAFRVFKATHGRIKKENIKN